MSGLDGRIRALPRVSGRWGERGEWWVVGQVALILLLLLGPRTAGGIPAWPDVGTAPTFAAGLVLICAGGGLLLLALLRLGRGVTPLPHPKAGVDLVRTGPYRVVRHPMYCGGILFALGWALVVQGWLTLLYAVALAVYLDFKATREERWLAQAYPDYPEYQRRVWKLIPFVR